MVRVRLVLLMEQILGSGNRNGRGSLRACAQVVSHRRGHGVVPAAE